MKEKIKFYLFLLFTAVFLYGLGGVLLANIDLSLNGSGPHGYRTLSVVVFPMLTIPAGFLVALVSAIFIPEPNYKKGIIALLSGLVVSLIYVSLKFGLFG